VKSIAREAGYRSKIAVAAASEGIDPVGCCVGLRGIRIQNIMRELNGEKLDVVTWSSSPQTFIANALSPAQVISVALNENEGIATVVVPDKQLSLAIGKEGQNARLAAKLTGWRIDIKSASTAEVEQLAKAEAQPEEEIEAELPGIEEPVLASAEAAAEPGAPLETELVPPKALLKSQGKSETSQLRFAEDVLKFAPTKVVAKSKKKKKETREKRVDDGAKARKRRQKPELPDEEEEY
jgi:N utilization substance protein A